MTEQRPPETAGSESRPETNKADSPHIYVASLSDYNAGILHGVWLDANDTVDGLQDGIDQVLATSPARRRYGEAAEEWAIHDYEGFGRYRLGEYEPLEKIAALASGIERYGEAFTVWADHDPDVELGRYDLFEDAYQGVYGSTEDYGDQLLEEQGISVEELPGIPESLQAYVEIDTAGWVRDMEIGGDIWTEECNRGIYVFWSN